MKTVVIKPSEENMEVTRVIVNVINGHTFVLRYMKLALAVVTVGFVAMAWILISKGVL